MPRTAADPARRRARERRWFAAVAALMGLAYARSFSVPFQFDDTVFLRAAAVRAPTAAGLLGFGRARLLPVASLALNYRLGGDDPRGYHLVNFAVHLLATFAVYQLALALCRTPRLRDTALGSDSLPVAVAAAVVFGCHPIQIQAVTYIVQRMTALSTLFYVGAVLAYIRARNARLGLEDGRPARRYAASVGLALAAFLSKESSASLPFAILLAEWTFFPAAGAARRLARLAPFLALAAVIPLAWWLFGVRPGRAPGLEAPLAEQARYLVDLLAFRAHPSGSASPLQYLMTQCLVLPRYLGLVALPWGFNVDHDMPLVAGPSLPVAAGAALLVGLFAAGLYARRRWPLVGFGILWFFVALSVESSLLPIQDAMVEHRMYLAMPGVALALAAAYTTALRRWRPLTLAAGAALAAALCLLTLQRNEVWRTPVALWRDAAAKSPAKARPHVNLGSALLAAGDAEGAIAQYCRALEIAPGDALAAANLESALAAKFEAANGVVMLERLEQDANGRLTLVPPDPCATPRDRNAERGSD